MAFKESGSGKFTNQAERFTKEGQKRNFTDKGIDAAHPEIPGVPASMGKHSNGQGLRDSAGKAYISGPDRKKDGNASPRPLRWTGNAAASGQGHEAAASFRPGQDVIAPPPAMKGRSASGLKNIDYDQGLHSKDAGMVQTGGTGYADAFRGHGIRTGTAIAAERTSGFRHADPFRGQDLHNTATADGKTEGEVQFKSGRERFTGAADRFQDKSTIFKAVQPSSHGIPAPLGTQGQTQPEDTAQPEQERDAHNDIFSDGKTVAGSVMASKRQLTLLDSHITKDRGYSYKKTRPAVSDSAVFRADKQASASVLFKPDGQKKGHTFKEKKPGFLEKGQEFAEDVTFDEKNAASSNLDQFLIHVLDHRENRHRRLAGQYRAKEKYEKSELRDIIKEKRKKGDEKETEDEASANKPEGALADSAKTGEMRVQGSREPGLNTEDRDAGKKRDIALPKELEASEGPGKIDARFKSSLAAFQNDEGKFSDRFADAFHIEGKDARGNDIFLQTTKKQEERTAAVVPTAQGAAAMQVSVSPERNQAVQSFVEGFDRKDGEMPERSLELREGFEEHAAESKFSGSATLESGEQLREAEPYFNDAEHELSGSGKKEATGRSKEEQGGQEKDQPKKEEKKDPIKDKKKEVKQTKKQKKKQLRRAGAAAAFSNTLSAKRNIQNQLGDMSGQSSGDLMKEGSTGLLTAFTDGVKNVVFNLLRRVAVWLSPVFFILAVVILMMGTFTVMAGVIHVNTIDEGAEYDVDYGGIAGDGYTFSSLAPSQIDSIISSLWMTYPSMTYTQEQLLRYALSKVGCAYNQDYHASLNANIFDCSSLAYRSYREVGIDISTSGIYSAAEECRAMENRGHVVASSAELQPGDLIFYGGSSNGRYRGVYHVAIYVGNGKIVEAKGKSYGVLYGDVRWNNVVVCARP